MTIEKERSSYHHGDLRTALLEVARSLIEERGVEGLSLREVARRAGVSRAAPYHHFRNKEAMAAAVAQHGFEELVRCMDDIPDDLSPLCQLEACGRSYMGFALGNPTLYRLMFGTKVGSMADHPTLQETAGCAFELLESRIRRAVGPDDAAAHAMAVWAAVHGLASLVIDQQGPYDTTDPANVERWVDAAMDLLNRGLIGLGSHNERSVDQP